ncbi:type II toxin-antitoxin system death-on-curing family toxin [Bacillus sp. EB600]|uniref:type II toxin-antitoxin system death-on-curing family toxin n=1 Tax=Bacillus sp. EB600 TaxID=2806345 RepID=UPI00210990C2|nr:type II toxin-antitoxin system death-on-curing family toxin [Bacillus sp. EB600]MCQ6282669.1 type II toxin-antitoxin system death-on-curing family toxin [Bacillus sp. EB600]
MIEVEYLEVEDVELLHDLALKEYGGLAGREPGKLEGNLALPMSGFGDFERFPSIEEKAAVYHYYLASGHCFVDGNKRTSYLAAFTFLDWNGFDLIADDEEVYKWTLKLADKEEYRPPFEEAVVWISNHMYIREE